MFEPKVYKKNGLEAFRLAGSDGSDFFYEGAIDCNENEIYRDEQGRLYYPVVTEIGGAVKYFVELELDFPLIPYDNSGDREKEISLLINASPRAGRQLPEDVFVPQGEETITAGEDAGAQQASEEETSTPAETATPEPEPAGESPAPESVVKPIEKLHVREPAKADEPYWKKNKSRSLAIPLAIGLVVLVLIAAVVGVYILKPGAIKGVSAIFSPGATPTPVPSPSPEPSAVPMVTATPEPTPAPTAEPETQGLSTDTLLGIQPLIDSNNATLSGFAVGHVDSRSGANKVRQAYDLYTFVNKQWTDLDSPVSEGLPASTLSQTLKGNSRDYSVLMCALTTSIGLDSRIIAYYKDDQLYYYPEILVANSTEGYAAVKSDLKTWFGVSQPYGHSDGKDYWLSLSRGTAPGSRVDSAEEYAVYVHGPPVKVK